MRGLENGYNSSITFWEMECVDRVKGEFKKISYAR